MSAKPPAPVTVSVQQTLVRMHEDSNIDTTITKTLLEPGDSTTPPLYALMVKVAVGQPQPPK